MPLPVGRSKGVGFIFSDQQAHWWARCRRGPAWWQQSYCHCRCFFLQVSEYLVDYRRVFDAGNDAHITTAFTAGFNVDIKYPLQPLRPCHLCQFLSGGLILCPLPHFGFSSFTSFCRRHPCSILAIGRKHPVKAGKMDSWFGYQGGQPGDEIQWFE